ncbi:MAG: hypothetical protein WCT18_02000, partial [Patescibacteria group bacterium]
RDTKRLSDVDAIKNAMEYINSEYGSYNYNLASPACAAGAKISTCIGGNLQNSITSLKNLIDPVGTVACTASSDESCDYSLTATTSDYTVYFYLETGAGQFKSPGLYKLTKAGIDMAD